MTRDGILILDSESALVVDTNPFLTQLLGCEREDLVSRSFAAVDALADRPMRAGLFEEVRREGYACRWGLPAKTRDGRVILVDVVANSYLVNDKKVIQLNISDATDPYRARLDWPATGGTSR